MSNQKEKLFTWIISIVFAAGIAWSSIIKIPSIEKKQNELIIQAAVTDTNYKNIKESLKRIEEKLDTKG